MFLGNAGNFDQRLLFVANTRESDFAWLAFQGANRLQQTFLAGSTLGEDVCTTALER